MRSSTLPFGASTYVSGQPVFDAATIAKTVMTPEQEAAAQQGWCMKCAQPSLSQKHQAEGMRWLQCSRCTSVYVLPHAVSVKANCSGCKGSGWVNTWVADESDRSGQSDHKEDIPCPECGGTGSTIGGVKEGGNG